MTPALDPAAAGFAEAVRTLERALAETRAHWDDTTRKAFDRQHADAILGDAKQSAAELQQLAVELRAAARVLGNPE